ncbi:MAG TPA: hypothetical protein VIL48_13060 [Acidimicrobiales bacterium]
MSRDTIVKAATFARVAGIVFVIVGAVGAAAWLWLTVRLQLLLDGPDPTFGARNRPTREISLVDRVTVTAHVTEYLLCSALAVGVGFGLRLAADFAVVRAGGSLTGLESGDPAPAELPPPEYRDPAPGLG